MLSEKVPTFYIGDIGELKMNVIQRDFLSHLLYALKVMSINKLASEDFHIYT